MSVREQLIRSEYLWWAAMQSGATDKSCPGCGGKVAKLIRRKYLVTSLHECPICRLRFRIPKETSRRVDDLYKKEAYRQGFTTTLPGREELTQLLATGFAGTEKDYGRYIKLLQSLLLGGSKILDFGSSWGYGSWQMSQAGFVVKSYEVGQQRAQYAAAYLGCTMVENLRSLDGTIDCFFSAHVIEHLPDPNIVFVEAAKLLAPGGYFVCYCPNGNPDRERIDASYHKIWGKVHPLLITPNFMRWACERHGFVLLESTREDLIKDDLLTVARKAAE